MRSTLILSLLVSAHSAYAIESTRRTLMGWLGGGVLSLTTPPSAVATPPPPATRSIDLDMVARARAQQLRQEFMTHQSMRIMPDKAYRAWRTSDEPRRIKGDLAATDVDVIADWAKMTPEGQFNAEIVGRWIELVEAGMRTPEVKNLEARIKAQLREEPWVSLDWMEVFGTRLAVAEIDVQARTGLELYEVQELIKLLINSVGTWRAPRDFISHLTRSGNISDLYRGDVIRAVVDAIQAIAPGLARSIEELHLTFADSPQMRAWIRQAAGGDFNYGFENPDEVASQPRLMNSTVWEHELIGYSQARFVDDPQRSGPTFEADLRRRAQRIDGLIGMNLEYQTGLLKRLETRPDSPLRTALLEDARAAMVETEFERATIPRRLLARAILETEAHAVSLDPELIPRWEKLIARIPRAGSRAWAHWRPSRDMLVQFEARQGAWPAWVIADLARPGGDPTSWTAQWLAHVLSRRVAITGELVAWLLEPTATNDSAESEEPRLSRIERDRETPALAALPTATLDCHDGLLKIDPLPEPVLVETPRERSP